MSTDITEHYLNKVYEDLHREQVTLVSTVKTSLESEKEKSVTKQVAQVSQLVLGCLRLRSTGKQLSSNSI